MDSRLSGTWALGTPTVQSGRMHECSWLRESWHLPQRRIQPKFPVDPSSTFTQTQRSVTRDRTLCAPPQLTVSLHLMSVPASHVLCTNARWPPKCGHRVYAVHTVHTVRARPGAALRPMQYIDIQNAHAGQVFLSGHPPKKQGTAEGELRVLKIRVSVRRHFPGSRTTSPPRSSCPLQIGQCSVSIYGHTSHRQWWKVVSDLCYPASSVV